MKTFPTIQFDWVCEDDWKGPFTQSVAFLGAVFGGFIFGAISDYYGRYDSPTVLGSSKEFGQRLPSNIGLLLRKL